MLMQTGMNNETLKRRNRGLILKLITTGECATRIDLARRTGLSKMSVSNVINEFLAEGIVAERDAVAVRGQGRNPIELVLSPAAPKLIGLHVFRDECVAVLCDLHLTPLREARVRLDEEKAGRLTDVLCGLIDRVLPGAEERVLGIGVGSIGPVELSRGVILNPPRFFGVHDYPIVDELSARFRLPVYLDGQYNCAALAEKYFGSGRPYQDFVFVGISNGIGSGVLSGGEVLRAAGGLTSELGHVSIDWHGNPCACGNRGCLETYAGTHVLERRFWEQTGERLDFAGICARADEPLPAALLGELVDALGCALTTHVNLLQPEAILLGHEGCALPDRFLHQLEELVNRRRLVRGTRRVPVLRSAFGVQAQVRSSACSLLSHVFEGEFV